MAPVSVLAYMMGLSLSYYAITDALMRRQLFTVGVALDGACFIASSLICSSASYFIQSSYLLYGKS